MPILPLNASRRIHCGEFDRFDAAELVLWREHAWWIAFQSGSAEGEAVMAAWRQDDGSVAVVLPLADERGRAMLRADDGRWALTHDGVDPGAVVAAADDVAAALKLAAEAAGWRRQVADDGWYDQLGWCTWDAFYQSVSAEGVLDGLRRWVDVGLVPGTLILDDGWLDARYVDDAECAADVNPNGFLSSFDANAKFPDGLAPLVAECKRLGVRKFGVWHTLMGYWCGVDPDGPLAEAYTVLRRDARDIGQPTLPHTSLRGLVDAADVGRFYDDWYAQLAAAGVDFVKVDNGGSLPEFCDAADEHAVTAAYHKACRDAAAKHFGAGSLLPCMSMTNAAACAPDVGGAVAAFRNSNDYFPKKPESHTKHVRDNAAAAAWTSGFALPDWDMFYSRHEWAPFHAAARAISGGPIYVSDEPGRSDLPLIRRLIDGAGRALRFDGPAEAADFGAGRTLVRNSHERGEHRSVTLGTFLFGDGPATLTASDLPNAGEAVVYLSRADAAYAASELPDMLAERWELACVVTLVDGVAVIGWSDALCPPITVRDVRRDGETWRVTLRRPGTKGAALLVWSGDTLHRLVIADTELDEAHVQLERDAAGQLITV